MKIINMFGPMLTAEELIAFEKDIADCFNRGEIRAPIHLDGGNEQQLIQVFKDVNEEDWVCCSWRSHYKALLKSVPPAKVKAAILAGHSITLCFPEYRVISSAIVGGILPIALGIAWSIKRNGGKNCVHCFVGDMTSTTGMFTECAVYSQGHGLPIRWIIEDNQLSVCTPTRETWGKPFGHNLVMGYRYDLAAHWPHSGAGKRISF